MTYYLLIVFVHVKHNCGQLLQTLSRPKGAMFSLLITGCLHLFAHFFNMQSLIEALVTGCRLFLLI